MWIDIYIYINHMYSIHLKSNKFMNGEHWIHIIQRTIIVSISSARNDFTHNLVDFSFAEYICFIWITFSESSEKKRNLYFFFPHGCPTAGRNLRLVCLILLRFHFLWDAKKTRMWSIYFKISIYIYTYGFLIFTSPLPKFSCSFQMKDILNSAVYQGNLRWANKQNLTSLSLFSKHQQWSFLFSLLRCMHCVYWYVYIHGLHISIYIRIYMYIRIYIDVYFDSV